MVAQHLAETPNPYPLDGIRERMNKVSLKVRERIQTRYLLLLESLTDSVGKMQMIDWQKDFEAMIDQYPDHPDLRAHFSGWTREEIQALYWVLSGIYYSYGDRMKIHTLHINGQHVETETPPLDDTVPTGVVKIGMRPILDKIETLFSSYKGRAGGKMKKKE